MMCIRKLEGILLPVKWVFDDRIRFIRTRVRKWKRGRFLHLKKIGTIEKIVSALFLIKGFLERVFRQFLL